MNPLSLALQVGGRHTAGFGPGVGPGAAHPWFWVGAIIWLGLSVATVAAIVYVAWRVGSYYGAAKKKL